MATTHAILIRERELATAHGTFSTRLYRVADGAVGLALWVGELGSGAPVACRLHSSCFTSEGLGGLDCDCVSQLDKALGAIAAAGRGVVLYLLQEGRGAGLRAKFRDREIVQTSGGAIDTFGAYEQLGLPRDPRTYGIVPPICSDLGIPPRLRLMTNNPAKISALVAAGIEVERVPHALPPSAFNSAYLHAKANSGHALGLGGTHTNASEEKAPGELAALDPRLETVGRFRRIASYSLPVQVGERSVWFRATVYTDPSSGHDRVLLGYRAPGANGHEVRHVYRERLEERLTSGGPVAARYRAFLERVVAHGAGSVLAVPADGELLLAQAGPGEGDERALLDAHGQALGVTRAELHT